MANLFVFAVRIIDGQSHHCSSPAARFRRSVAKINDEARALEYRSDQLTLDADPLAVNYARATHTAAVRFFKEILDDRANLLGRDRVQVNHVLELDCDNVREWIVVVERFAFGIIGDPIRRALGAAEPETTAKSAE